ncbi:MAG: acyl-[ACP]--phospholipid O-acyltransferase [Verrucomicrobiota bacterium]|nr:acyl-[ACP]--phospholipid O-acyltransferase [Verrucomicrobiota bacterium]
MDVSPTSPATINSTGIKALKGFWALFLVQYQGAFSDNLFKFLVIFSSINSLVGEQETVRDFRLFLIVAVFALPFIFFSMAAGCLADRYSKGRVITWTKRLEFGIMILGVFALKSGEFNYMLGVILLMSIQSAIFSPAKYASLPELLPNEKLSWGNGVIGLGTFGGIIAGGTVAGLLSSFFKDDVWKCGWLLVILAVAGAIASRWITRHPAASPGKRIKINFIGDLIHNLKMAGKNRVLGLAIMGSIYFWLVAALYEPTLVVFGKDLELTDFQISLMRACLAVGISIGSVSAGYLSQNKVEYGLIPLGSLGLAICSIVLGFFELHFAQISFLLVCLGISGGFFNVPVSALIQKLPDKANKGSVIAANGWLTALAMGLAALIFYLFKVQLGIDAKAMFWVIGLTTIAGTIYAVWLVPDSLARFALWALTNTLYRVRVLGRNNLPERGGALLVSNHISLADALFVIASTGRRIRFLMHRDQFNKWWIKPIAKMLRVIPIASDFGPKELLKSLKKASDCLKGGELVCIFAEGQISRIGGQTLAFQKGMELIMRKQDAPIIPVHLDNVWGSIFSFHEKKVYWKVPRQIPYPVTVSYGKSMPTNSSHTEVRREVVALGADAWAQRKGRISTIGRAFVRTARRARTRMAFADSTGKKLSYMRALAAVIVLIKRLRKDWDGQQKVGILIPPSVGGALTNLAGILMGKTVVNLNYTLSEEGIRSCVQQCDIKCVISSEKVIRKLKLDPGVPMLALEDIAKDPSFMEKMSAAFLAYLCPRGILLKKLSRGNPPSLDDIATIIFSSGSTGEPKGAMLSHYNIVSNMMQLNQAYDFKRDDRFLGVLPFFHSLGFTATLIGPAVIGVGAAYHPLPTDTRSIGKLIPHYKLTLLLATPTFLQLYLRGIKPEQMQSINLVVVGAEKLPERLAVAFEEKFSLQPLEAYGCTECSPGVAVNTPSLITDDLSQTGNRPGTIGRALPGMSIKIVDPETEEPCGFNEPGLMWVRGPNIMQGYLGKESLTAEVLVDGWYNTGDIASVDEEGFITITDRLSRFSKIGGEMVPHIKIEELLHNIAELTEQTFAVTGLPDEKKGERLVVLHTLEQENLKEITDQFATADIPNLWKPKTDQFFRVDELPYLGSGKLDLKAIKTIALEIADE